MNVYECGVCGQVDYAISRDTLPICKGTSGSHSHVPEPMMLTVTNAKPGTTITLRIPSEDDGEPDWPHETHYCSDRTQLTGSQVFAYDEIACMLYLESLIAEEFSSDLAAHWVDDARTGLWGTCEVCGSIVPASFYNHSNVWQLWAHTATGRYITGLLV